LYIAPAMNTCMWQHPLTQNNITTLVGIGATLLGPDAGLLACGEVGEGRMLDTVDLAQQVLGSASKHSLQGKTLVITAGPTREAIDPVRYVSNHSSGKMGYAMAAAAVKAGANVILISGPTGLATPPGVLRIDVESAQQMLTAVLQHMSHSDVFIGAAAVCDYGVAQPSLQKLKKDQAHFEIKWQQTPDIIQQVAQLSNKPFVVGFAAETDNVLVHARDKLQRKQLDMIIANDVSDGRVFGRDHNEVTVIDSAGKQTILPTQTKAELAVVLIDVMVDSMTVMV
jgi:phosphopantothenoylcysteine decarboxylase / phosphopantothenate---cysteine ligase